MSAAPQPGAEAQAIRRAAETPVAAGPSELDAAAADLAAAFSDYPMFQWFMRTDVHREAALGALFRMMVRQMAYPQGRVMRPATGGAAAVWIDSRRLAALPFLQEVQSLPTLLRATGLARFGRLAATRAAMDRTHPMDRPHMYLWLLGVHPANQGLGIGSRMLAAGLAQADAEGLPTFLETSTEANVALYRRYGFEITHEYWVRPGSPPTWTMWREPQG